jgi:uncharacterized protein (DUF302 family)
MKLEELTIDQLREEVRRRGFELHSLQVSQASQNALRELEGLRRRGSPRTAKPVLVGSIPTGASLPCSIGPASKQ